MPWKSDDHWRKNRHDPGEAKYCLVQYNENTAKEPVISIVLKADSRDNMYLLMSEMLKNFAN